MRSQREPSSGSDVGRSEASASKRALAPEALPDGRPLRVPERFGVRRLLGRGASGTVYEAFDRTRGATIALKYLHVFDAASVFRFKSEFRALADLTHPNLLQLYELLSYGDDWLLVMEFVDGCDFLAHTRPELASPHADDEESEQNTWLGGDTESVLPTLAPRPSPRKPALAPISWSAAADKRLRKALLQLAEGLQALHRADRLHRDLKPANVLVSRDGRVVICDFGLTLEGGAHATLGSELAARGCRFEAAGELAGTMPFMSPEQARGATLSAASDWYSVGVMLYQVLTGRVPVDPSLPYPAAVRAKLELPLHPSALAPSVPNDLAELALALLAPDPAKRAGYTELARVLAGGDTRAEPRRELPRALLGRERELALLRRAARHANTRGEPALALVSGRSGMGKSALVQSFLAELERERGALVLRARCYEHEELPYKAFDPLIDALGSHLMRLDPAKVEALAPPSIVYLAELFPALRRVRGLARHVAVLPDAIDPRGRRKRAFRALRELLIALAGGAPLVLFIDDLQWGDLDSALLFDELLAPPNAPPLLFVCAYRSEDAERSPLLRALREGLLRELARTLHVIDVAVLPLEPEAAAGLAGSLLPVTAERGAISERIAEEAAYSPFFVCQLAQYAAEHGGSADARVTLDELIEEKLRRVTVDGRVLLSVVALAGSPIASNMLQGASGVAAGTLRALRELEAQRLIASNREGDEERFECAHDRIREAVRRSVDEPTRRTLHRALAEAFARAPEPDIDALLEHWRAAGDRENAYGYALQGARKAEAALAFVRAAELYREAIGLGTADGDASRELREKLGAMLTYAGRGAEAAAVFLSLVAGANGADTLRYRLLAVTQLLRAGRFDEGFRELASADELVGVRFPQSELGAFARLSWMTLRIRWQDRTLDRCVRECAEGRVAPAADGAQLDALWEVAAAVTSANFLRGSVYGAALTLRAMHTRDPRQLAGAAGLEAVSSAASNQPARVERMLALADRATALTDDTLLKARVAGMRAVCCVLQGHFRDGTNAARESQALHLKMTQNGWDYAIMSWWEIMSLSMLGDVRDVSRRVGEALREAEARGDVYAATGFRTTRCSWGDLAYDRPDRADAQLAIAEREWVPIGYQFQSWHKTYARAEIDLYRGEPHRAFERLLAEWPRARAVRLVQNVRVDMTYTRARLALACALESREPRLLKLARADGHALLRERKPYTTALGKVVLASVAAYGEDARSRTTALQLLLEAERASAASELALHGAIVRVRRAQLEASDSTGVANALAEVRAFGIERPERFVAMLAPLRVP